jgi:hypothetical protein
MIEPNPHDWHKRPPGCKGPCTVCGCPEDKTRQHGAYHRAMAPGENSLARFVIRTPSAKSGYRQTLVYELTAEQTAAIPSPEQPGATGPDPFLWHPRPERARGNCPVCGCPPEGTRGGGQLHRAIVPNETMPFHFIVCPTTCNGFYTPVCPVASPTTAAAAPTGPGDTTLTLMARAAMLHTMGKQFPQIERRMKLKRATVFTWKSHWPEHWEAACDSARGQIVKTVKAQIGTAGILDDVDGYLERAEFAERAGALPKPARPTVATFFESYVLPNCLYDAKPVSIKVYRTAVKLWRLITGDPPLESVTSQTLTLYRNALGKRRGLQRISKAASATVAKQLRHIQAILDKAGPSGRRNRDAQGLIASPPWIRPPRVEMKLPRVISPEMFKLVYDATAGMDRPWTSGIKPPAWWKALLVVTYNTQLRRRTLFEMRMDEIDWQIGCLRLPAARFKSRRPMIVHLNAAAVGALRGIRTARELVFPTGANATTFDKWFHHLQNLAAIPRKEHFGLHAIRKTAATIIAGLSPQAAQLALGHASLRTTINNYINPTSIVGAALDAMPQPFGLSTP